MGQEHLFGVIFIHFANLEFQRQMKLSSSEKRNQITSLMSTSDADYLYVLDQRLLVLEIEKWSPLQTFCFHDHTVFHAFSTINEPQNWCFYITSVLVFNQISVHKKLVDTRNKVSRKVPRDSSTFSKNFFCNMEVKRSLSSSKTKNIGDVSVGKCESSVCIFFKCDSSDFKVSRPLHLQGLEMLYPLAYSTKVLYTVRGVRYGYFCPAPVLFLFSDRTQKSL